MVSFRKNGKKPFVLHGTQIPPKSFRELDATPFSRKEVVYEEMPQKLTKAKSPGKIATFISERSETLKLIKWRVLGKDGEKAIIMKNGGFKFHVNVQDRDEGRFSPRIVREPEEVDSFDDKKVPEASGSIKFSHKYTKKAVKFNNQDQNPGRVLAPNIIEHSESNDVNDFILAPRKLNLTTFPKISRSQSPPKGSPNFKQVQRFSPVLRLSKKPPEIIKEPSDSFNCSPRSMRLTFHSPLHSQNSSLLPSKESKRIKLNRPENPMSNQPQLPKQSTKLFLDPDTIRHKELYNYASLDSIKIQQSLLNYKRSIPLVGGVLLGCFLLKGYVDAKANEHVFGNNGAGGQILKMYTTNTNYDYYYNREFQRMRYLTEDPAGDDPHVQTKDELLVDLGYKVQASGNNTKALKKSPHYKYF